MPGGSTAGWVYVAVSGGFKSLDGSIWILFQKLEQSCLAVKAPSAKALIDTLCHDHCTFIYKMMTQMMRNDEMKSL